MDEISVLNIMLKLNECRKTGINCDVTLIVKEQKFYAHKSILAAAVEYFEKLFTGDFAEKEKNVITLNGIDPDGFSPILHFIYTEEIAVNDENFYQILSVAVYYQIECLIKKLLDYVKRNISAGNGFYYYHLADSIGVETMKQFTKEFIRNNFISCCSNSATFLDTARPVLLEFLDSPIVYELDRFKIIMKWIENDLNERSGYLSDLIKYVNFEYISADVIFRDIFDYPLVINNLQIIQTIRESKKTGSAIKIYGMNGSDLIQVDIVKTKLIAACVKLTTKIDYDEFQIASSADAVYVSVFKKGVGNNLYRFKDSQWILLNSDHDLDVANQSVVYFEKQNSIYMHDGVDIYGYNLDANAYVHQHGIRYRSCRQTGSLVCHNDFIYTTALCSDGQSYVIRYDSQAYRFRLMVPLLKCCPNAVNAVLDDEMYVIGGGIIQMYDIKKNSCTLIFEDKQNNIYHSLIAHENRLYAVSRTWDKIHVFDLSKKMWTETINLMINGRNIFNISNTENEVGR